jgi:single-strand selective monofunctional uracil DNA glycosylase
VKSSENMIDASPHRRGERFQNKATFSVDEMLVQAARKLCDVVESLKFSKPVTHTYNPLQYAWRAHEQYLRRFGSTSKRIVFLGMNPGPFGMVQTGVPFGEIKAVREWLGIHSEIGRPAREHPKRPIEGFECPRSEVSGQRLWGLFAARFGPAEEFFREHIVMNYCPLAFLEDSGRNLTPDKLPAGTKTELFEACDQHLRETIAALQPAWVIGIGGFAAGRATEALKSIDVEFGQILHPSPASPLANRGWAETVTRQLETLGIWNRNQKV